MAVEPPLGVRARAIRAAPLAPARRGVRALKVREAPASVSRTVFRLLHGTLRFIGDETRSALPAAKNSTGKGWHDSSPPLRDAAELQGARRNSSASCWRSR